VERTFLEMISEERKTFRNQSKHKQIFSGRRIKMDDVLYTGRSGVRRATIQSFGRPNLLNIIDERFLVTFIQPDYRGRQVDAINSSSEMEEKDGEDAVYIEVRLVGKVGNVC
jgi:pyrimidine operon attenuation protein/uracil phosphoribosyltransferase